MVSKTTDKELNKVNKKSEDGKKVSIIVCTLNMPTLKECLESIYSQTYEDFEVIIVSPNNDIETRILEFGGTKFGDIKFLISDKASVSRQRNMGIKHARGEIVAFIDDDSIANKDWILNLMKNYTNEDIMCVGGKIIPRFSGKVSDELKKLPDGIFKGFVGWTVIESENSTEINIPALWASNISFRKEVFEIIGGFDEELGKTPDKLMCEEEIDIQAKILNKGYKIIYEPKSIVTHIVDSKKLTKNYFIKRAFWQGFSEVIKIRKYNDFQKELIGMKPSQLDYMNNIKLAELMFELSANTNLEKNVKASYEIGRMIGLSHLAKR